jgi:hypothetical protein
MIKINRGGTGHLITCRGIMVKLVVGFIWWKGLWRFVEKINFKE